MLYVRPKVIVTYFLAVTQFTPPPSLDDTLQMYATPSP
jgi:hypothetical protein